MKALLVAVAALAWPACAWAQAERSDEEWRAWQPDPAEIALVDVAGGTRPDEADDFDKYFYFHRADTGFAQALTDIRECDARARGFWRVASAAASNDENFSTPYGLVGGAAQALIFGPAQDRLARRATLRRCMFFKGYGRYGVGKDMWESFNFARDGGDLGEEAMQRMLAQQARLASGPQPAGAELGL
ncbi:hypothetical protein [Aurantiacibacter spongiae]|uniref:Uncharacterized protein n=1 Tax=Aurantiacibacter spongiae TaxID=2488860 RepID=A0A3N5DMB4_9SPHN|nr:hypothetical protein [Aurantiacibacter spongiae]RPF71995.1 hypothetical protein EG799_10510 [Aurantiacibacter spongiae]